MSVVRPATRPTTVEVTGDGAVSHPVHNEGVLASVFMDYTAGSGGSDRAVAVEVLNERGQVIAHAPAGAVITAGTAQTIGWHLGGVHLDAPVDGVLHANLPTIPLWKGYTVQCSQDGAAADADDTVVMRVHLLK